MNAKEITNLPIKSTTRTQRTMLLYFSKSLGVSVCLFCLFAMLVFGFVIIPLNIHSCVHHQGYYKQGIIGGVGSGNNPSQQNQQDDYHFLDWEMVRNKIRSSTKAKPNPEKTSSVSTKGFCSCQRL